MVEDIVLAAMVGVAQKDDDGNSISNANPRSAVDKYNAKKQ